MLNGKILKAFILSQRDRHEVKKNGRWEVKLLLFADDITVI